MVPALSPTSIPRCCRFAASAYQGVGRPLALSPQAFLPRSPPLLHPAVVESVPLRFAQGEPLSTLPPDIRRIASSRLCSHHVCAPFIRFTSFTLQGLLAPVTARSISSHPHGDRRFLSRRHAPTALRFATSSFMQPRRRPSLDSFFFLFLIFCCPPAHRHPLGEWRGVIFCPATFPAAVVFCASSYSSSRVLLLFAPMYFLSPLLSHFPLFMFLQLGRHMFLPLASRSTGVHVVHPHASAASGVAETLRRRFRMLRPAHLCRKLGFASRRPHSLPLSRTHLERISLDSFVTLSRTSSGFCPALSSLSAILPSFPASSEAPFGPSSAPQLLIDPPFSTAPRGCVGAL